MGFVQQYECEDDYFKASIEYLYAIKKIEFKRYSFILQNSDRLLSYEVPRMIYLPLLSISNYLRHKLTNAALSDHFRIIRLNKNSYIKELSSLHNLFYVPNY